MMYKMPPVFTIWLADVRQSIVAGPGHACAPVLFHQKDRACTDMQNGQHAGVMCSGGGFLLGISMRPRLAGGSLVNTEHCAHV